MLAHFISYLHGQCLSMNNEYCLLLTIFFCLRTVCSIFHIRLWNTYNSELIFLLGCCDLCNIIKLVNERRKMKLTVQSLCNNHVKCFTCNHVWKCLTQQAFCYISHGNIVAVIMLFVFILMFFSENLQW